MGSPVSAVIAEIFVEDLKEDKGFASYPVVPRVWYRFADHIFLVVKKDDVQSPATNLLEQLTPADQLHHEWGEQ